MCTGLVMVVVTGVDGADVLLRDGSGGVGGRYTFNKSSASTNRDKSFTSHEPWGCEL